MKNEILKKLAESTGFLGWKDPEERGEKNNKWINFILSFIKNPFYVSVDDWNLEKGDWDESSQYYLKNSSSLIIFIALSKILKIDEKLNKLSSEMGGIAYVIFSKFPLKCCIRAYINIGENSRFEVKINDEKIQNTVVIEISVPIETIYKCKNSMTINNTSSSFPLNNGIVERKELLSIVERCNTVEVKIENSTSPELNQLISTCSNELFNQFKQLGVETSNEELGKYLEYIIRNLIYFFSIANKISMIKEIVYIPARGFIHEGKEMTSGGITIWVTSETEYILEELLIAQTIWCRRVSIWDWSRKSLSHALRSAVAAIMSRNMSHNIGSHVLAYYEQSLKEIYREAQPLDEAREKFNRYLQARMDYIAYVTTITPSYGVGFTLEEIINEFNENKILLKGLAASENFDEVQIKLENDKSTYKDLLSFPMGELGKHALFNIFEGIARNTAKHGYPQGGSGTLQIHVKPIDKGDFVQLEIWDDAKSYKKAKIALNLDGGKEKDARYHKFIDDTGALQSEFWGIKEMRVGSLFLKRIPLTKIQDDEILAIDCKNKEGSLCYVLNMYKFKYLLIASNKVNGFQRGRYIDMVNTKKLNELGKTEYKFCVIDQETTLSLEKEMNLPLRRIYDNIDDKKLVLSNNEENEKELVLKYYEKWLEKRCRLNSTEIIYSPLDDKVIEEIKDKWGKNITVKKIDPCTEDLKGKIIFAGHLIKSSINCEGKDELSYVQACLSKDPLFIQDVSGKTQYLKTILNNPPADDFKKWIFVYEIKEAACESVIIFDERLWKRYKEEEDYPEYLQKGQNIIFANLKSDNRGKEEIEFKDLKEQTVLTIKKQDSNGLSFEWENSKKYTFACFHLGIIEKISEIFDVGVSIVIENLSRNKKNTFEHLIIHTGRGKTLKYDRPLLYMDLTSLQRGVEEGKINLIQTLYSLKPTERG